MKKLIPFLCSLLVVTAACGGGSSPSSEDQKVVDDLAAVIAEDSEFDGTADDAECIAETIVTSLGSTYIRDNNLTDSGTYNDWDPFEAELSRDQFGQVLQGTFGCVTNEISNFLGDEADLDGLSKEDQDKAEEASLYTARYLWNFLSGMVSKHKLQIAA